ncbi:F-box/kelch-repeat protein [Pyrus ussuriensis x Pyrus communis]|uniref:F-box/kelch-repeat protein n=1 Tax=Pyrus ussuriensis x Pyrus communis TaxID=2448454 RepID=A0A5N5IBD4_9ROSA|nr:F-box/kelch-repeat protein [Pyrus ussuriensis x Pyrus communis]
MRFKCAAKWWYALINDHSFVDKHLSKSLHDNQSTRAFLKRMLVPTEDPNDNETQSAFSVLAFDNVAVDDGAARPNSSKVILWNPTIQEFRVLPSETYIPDWFNEPSPMDPHLRWKHLPYHPRSDQFNDVLGLGYDPTSKDYKVVKIGFSDSELHRGTKHSIIHPPRTEQQKEFIESTDANYDEYEYIRRVIVSFDMSREIFHDVLFLHDLFDFDGIIDGVRMCLKVWNESVALLRLDHFEDADQLTFEMWVMDDGSNGGANERRGFSGRG